jgi:O-antigen biosynthesis protein
VRAGLTPWRPPLGGWRLRPRVTRAVWTERWRTPEDRLVGVERHLRAAGVALRRGGDFDRWDLEVRGGLLAVARLTLLVEEHGSGRQLTRLRAWSRLARPVTAVAGALAALALAAAADGAVAVGAALGLGATALVSRALLEGAAAVGVIEEAWSALTRETPGAVVVTPRRVGDQAA